VLFYLLLSSFPFLIARPVASAIELSNCLERGLRESRAIDAEALCIVSEEKVRLVGFFFSFRLNLLPFLILLTRQVWCIRFDIRIIDDAGNLNDCCSVAAIVALHHARRPDISINDGIVEIVCCVVFLSGSVSYVCFLFLHFLHLHFLDQFPTFVFYFCIFFVRIFFSFSFLSVCYFVARIHV
jgi:exosome complex RNA-binding protein Rrp42 (RNase PH superfamily)